MKKISKSNLTALTLAGLMVLSTASVGAASVYKNVTARQNTTMTVQVDGKNVTMTAKDGTALHPLSYEGSTYLPAEQLASAVGYNATVTDSKVSLTKKTSTSTSASTSTDIGAEKAKQIALNHAGVSASNATFVKAQREYDDGRLTYDVDFYSGNKEFDYEILASDGTILSYDADIENYRIPSAASNTSSANYITADRAKEIALANAGLSSSQVSFVKAQFDWDDGRAEYEVEFSHSFREYEYTIDAVSGQILSMDRD